MLFNYAIYEFFSVTLLVTANVFWFFLLLINCYSCWNFGNTAQCGYSRNFLPIRFYVKLRVANLKLQKLPFYTFLRLKMTKNKISESPKLQRIAFLELHRSQKLISRKNWNYRKILKYSHCVVESFSLFVIICSDFTWNHYWWIHDVKNCQIRQIICCLLGYYEFFVTFR